MQHVVRLIGITLCSISLAGCLAQTELPGGSNTPLSDATDGDGMTSDQDNSQVGIPLGDDALVAPLEPLLRVQAAPGALSFTWEDRLNETPADITTISLYEYDYRSDQEVIVDADIEPSSNQYTLAVAPHQLSWDSSSYRIEICTPDDCVSSQRMPVQDLLSNAVTPITPDNTLQANSFGDHVALNATGNVAVITSPASASALVLFHVADRWIQASTLTSNNFPQQAGATMRAALSASGDTIAIASIANNTSPNVVVFDRLGENWFESSSMVLSVSSNATESWYTDSLVLDLSDNGDRLAVTAHRVNPTTGTALNSNNQVMVFDRGNTSWVNTAALSVPVQHTRMPAFSTSSNLDTVFVLSAVTGSLYLHEFALAGNTWREAEPQFISAVVPSIDTIVASSEDADQLVIAGWETESNGSRSPVAWRFANTAGTWLTIDSVKLPPTTATNASLRLAADGQLTTIAIGWQSTASANLAFYGQRAQRWQHLFSVPDAFNLNRNLPLVQSVAISADNSTTFIGTSNTGNGGVVSAFR